MIRVLLILCLMAPTALAEEVVGALSQNRVAITANFDGSEIFVFGAVKRVAPVPDDAQPLHVVVTIQGPDERVTVRRKERWFGIWVNRDSIEVDQAPSFYTIATTGPLEEIMSATERLRYGIGFDRVVRLVGAPDTVSDPRAFTAAIVRINKDNGLYNQLDGSIELSDETLFSTNVALPSNLVEGDYKTAMYLLRGGDVVNVSRTVIEVRKAGLERFIYTMAHERPLLYGILSIMVALAAGWGASEAFRLLRR